MDIVFLALSPTAKRLLEEYVLIGKAFVVTINIYLVIKKLNSKK